MDRQEALAELASKQPADRLRAARYFQRNAAGDDRQPLMLALRHESDRWVKHALSRAEHASLDQTSARHRQDGSRTRTLARCWRTSVRAHSRTSRRSLSTKYRQSGAARQDVRRELGASAYEGSNTKDDLDRLGRLLGALTDLSKAAAAPAEAEFDLAEVIEGATRRLADQEVRFQLAGPSP